MNFELEREVKLKVNLTPEEIHAKYGDSLSSEVEGKLYDVLSTLFNNLVGIKKIIVPKDFKSHRGSKAISCSVKAAEGYFFPLKSSLVFIHKPVIYIKHTELKHVEFSRLGARTFDLTVSKLKDEPNVTFLSIEREEYSILVEYFKAAGVKMKSVDD
jgi:structure-specific recognition protein 1